MNLEGLGKIGKFYRVGVKIMFEGSDDWTGKIRRVWAKDLHVSTMRIPGGETINVLTFEVVNSEGSGWSRGTKIEIVQAELVAYVYVAAEDLKYGNLTVVRDGRSSVHATEIEEALRS